MVTDSQTNFLFLSRLLTSKSFSPFLDRLTNILDDVGIKYTFLDGTNDIWARDYMPIQIEKDRFVQFKFDPSYYRNYKKYDGLWTDQNNIKPMVKGEIIKSSIRIDGGNVVKWFDKVILTNQVFEENKTIDKNSIEHQLHSLLEVNQLIIIPREPYDDVGHSDGIVQFISSDHVLVNQYLNSNPKYFDKLTSELKNQGLEYTTLPNPSYHNQCDDATGLYVNILRIGDYMFIPKFGLKEDDLVLNIFKDAYPHNELFQVECNEIAKKGGVLNCISWNILL